ncbi:MAG: VWA domain-containing protein [Vicinamibacterales bacterium]
MAAKLLFLPRAMRFFWATVLGAASLSLWPTAGTGQEAPVATFRSSVNVVQISAVVRDRAGRFVENLSSGDFEILDSGLRRTITEFRRDPAGVSVALLFDTSGSMEAQFARAREGAVEVLGRLQSGRDEVGIFAFDTRLREVAPFRTELGTLPDALSSIKPFGKTSLYDAIAQTAERLDAREQTRRRAVVVFTDGDDNASRLSAGEAQSTASTIDVPVYVFGLVWSHDVPPAEVPAARGDGETTPPAFSGRLGDLATGTGGRVFITSTAIQRQLAAQYFIDEVRHQYLIAFETSGRPGWHPLVVRTPGKDLAVRTRTGYYAGQSRPTRG